MHETTYINFCIRWWFKKIYSRDLNSLQIRPQNITLSSEITLRSSGLSITTKNSSIGPSVIPCFTQVPGCSGKHNKLSHFRGQYINTVLLYCSEQYITSRTNLSTSVSISIWHSPLQCHESNYSIPSEWMCWKVQHGRKCCHVTKFKNWPL